MKHTKIVATVGPASESKDLLRSLVEAGVNVFRLNFSHNEHAWHREVINRIREVSVELGRPVGILADLQGPRIRIAGDTEVTVSEKQRIRVSDISRAEFLPETGMATVLLDVAGIADALSPDRLAAVLASSIARSGTMSKSFVEQAEMQLQQARSRDSKQVTPSRIRLGRFTAMRSGGR